MLQPDLLFVAKARQHIITGKAIEGIPDLVIEILSPGTSRTDRETEAQIMPATVSLPNWIVDPEQEVIEIYLVEADGYRLTATLQRETPMFALPFTELQIVARDVFL